MEAANVHRRLKPIRTGEKSRGKKGAVAAGKKTVEQLMADTEVQHHMVEDVLSDADDEVAAKYYSYDRHVDKSNLSDNAPSQDPPEDLSVISYSSSHKSTQAPGQGRGSHRPDHEDNQLSCRQLSSVRSAFSQYSEPGLSYSSRRMGSTRSVLIQKEEIGPPQEITIKEIVEKIAKNIKTGRKMQNYVQDINELPNDKMYWNRKYPLLRKYKLKEMQGRANALEIKDDISELSGGTSTYSRQSKSLSSLPSLQASPSTNRKNNSPFRRIIDIQGCMQPVELILAKAAERIAKGSSAQHKWEITKEEQRVKVLESIENRETRAEKYVMKLKESYIIKAWMSIVYTLNYIKRIIPKFNSSTVEIAKHIKFGNASKVLMRAISRWYRNLIYLKYRRKLLGKISKDTLFYIRFKIRILRKRRAVKKVLYFFKTMKEQKKISFVVHRFVTSVKKIQRLCHDFLACKRARITMLTKMWDRLEPKFVTVVLNNRKTGVKKKGSDGKYLKISGITVKDLIELEKQTKKWNEIEQKMSATVLKQNLLGNLNSSSTDIVTKHLLHPGKKEDAITAILLKRRREFLVRLRNEVSAKLAKLGDFGEEDAFNLLQGKTAELNKIVKQKLEAADKAINCHRPKADSDGKHHRERLFFPIYTAIDRKYFYQEIKKAHIEAKTFEINAKSLKKKRGEQKQNVNSENTHSEHVDAGETEEGDEKYLEE